MRKLVAATISLLLFAMVGRGQSEQSQIFYKYYDKSDGLSQNNVQAILKDSRGILWVGTTSGLNTFDGFEFKEYTHSNKYKNTILNNYIYNIFEDCYRNIWLSTDGGLCCYSLDKGTIISLGSGKDATDVTTSYIRSICNTSDKKLWGLSSNQLIYFDYEHKFFKEYHLKSITPAFIKGVTWMASRGDKNLWFISLNGDILYSLETSSGKLNEYHNTSLQNRRKDLISQIYIDRDREVWVGKSMNDVFVFNQLTKSYRKINFAGYSSSATISNISQDADGNVWLSTSGEGVYLYNKRNQHVTHLLSNKNGKGQFYSNSVVTTFHDRDGSSWIGTQLDGLVYYNPRTSVFKFISDELGANSNRLNKIINNIKEDGLGNIWIATENGVKYATSKELNFKPLNLPSALNNTAFIAILCDSYGNVWFSSYRKGIVKYNLSRRSFTLYQSFNKNSPQGFEDMVYAMYEDKNRNIWIGTLGQGVGKFTNDFKRQLILNDANSKITSNYITSFCGDSKNRLWIGTCFGISLVTLDGKVIKNFLHSLNDTSTLSNNHVEAIYQDRHHRIWIATRNGLNLYDEDTQGFRHFTRENGLLDNSVFAIQEDRAGNLWVSTAQGLSQLSYNQQRNSYTIRNYNSLDGLQGKEFKTQSACISRSGMMLFGGVLGINAFYPDQIKPNNEIPKVLFTSLKLYNQEVDVDQKINGRVILDQDLNHIPKIVLRYRENIFSISFTALDYVKPQKCKYAYRLVGFNSDWVNTDYKNRNTTFTNLNPGKYTFQVKVCNSDGIWSESPTELQIVIRPPFWRTNLAIILFIVALAWGFWRARALFIERTKRKMIVEAEQHEIQRQHELNLLKLRFFTNVSHEFKTSLTLIISPVEELLRAEQSYKTTELLKVAHQNAKRLLSQVSQLLDLRKMESQGLKYYPSVGNIVQFVKDIATSFTDIAHKNSIELSFKANIQELQTNFDSDKLEKSIFNLINNAFKFTDKGGKVGIELRYNEQFSYNKQNTASMQNESSLEIIISDTGCGIKADDLDRIFQRFVQVHDTNTSGYGIGLSMVKEYVELHGGVIDVTSQEGVGSQFKITIPISRIEDHSTPEEDKTPINTKEKGAAPRSSILLVEDNVDMRHYLKVCLNNQFNIFEAGDGVEALEQLKHHSPDLIISDVMMPEMDGFEFCRRLRTLNAFTSTPVIMLTAKNSDNDKIIGYEAGADDFVTKPFNLDLLQLKIQGLIANRRKFKETFNNKHEIEPKAIEVVSLDEKLLTKAISIVEAHISDPDFSVETLSREIGMNRVHLYRRLMALTDHSPADFIRIIRLKRAAHLLKKSQLSISEIAYSVGFNNPKYFRKHFKEYFGILPSDYVESNKEDKENNGKKPFNLEDHV